MNSTAPQATPTHALSRPARPWLLAGLLIAVTVGTLATTPARADSAADYTAAFKGRQAAPDDDILHMPMYEIPLRDVNRTLGRLLGAGSLVLVTGDGQLPVSRYSAFSCMGQILANEGPGRAPRPVDVDWRYATAVRAGNTSESADLTVDFRGPAGNRAVVVRATDRAARQELRDAFTAMVLACGRRETAAQVGAAGNH